MADALPALAATTERSALIRRYTLRFIGLRGRAFSKELANRLRDRRGAHDMTVEEVRAELQHMETEGLLASRLERGPTTMRRYYRLTGVRCG